MDSFEKYEQKPDKAPFKKWEYSDMIGGASEFFSLPKYPDAIVRTIKALAIKKENGKLTAKKDVEHWRKQVKIFQNFTERYGIKTAKTGYFFGSDPKYKTNIPKDEKPMLMSATERIDGENIEEMRDIDETAAEKLDMIFSGMFSSLRDSYKENGYYWGDYSNKQILYGTAPNEKEAQAYVVDVGPIMTNLENMAPDKKESFFWKEAHRLFGEMTGVETKLAGEKKKLEKARAVLSQIIAKTSIPTEKNSQRLREEIKNKMFDNNIPFDGFVKSLSITGENSIFYDSSEHPELIVRKCRTPKELEKQIYGELAQSPEYENGDSEKKEEIANKKRVERLIENATAFQKMAERYGIRIAETKYVIGNGPDSKQPEIFALTDRISGTMTLRDMAIIPREKEEEFDEMYAGIFSHLRDSYRENKLFWKDFKNLQVMLGTKYGKKEEHPYIVDVDPMMMLWSDPKLPEYEKTAKEHPSEYREWHFWDEMERVFIHMKGAESKTISLNFKKARNVLKDIMKDIPEPDWNNRGAKEKYSSVFDDVKKREQ
ncbi:MAG: hypothetical protein WC878_04975 [Candidatus Paceibacterota bacterium]|jgi:hypothetical protein